MTPHGSGRTHGNGNGNDHTPTVTATARRPKAAAMTDNENKIQLFSLGDEEAFCWIYEKYVPTMRYFAAKYLGASSSVDDVVQDAFVSLWNKRRDFFRESAVRSYLYRAVQSSCLNILRHLKVRHKYATVYPREESIPSFLDSYAESEIFRALADAFDQLSPACRNVYEMSLQGMSQEEISQAKNISVNTIKKHKNNANHFLRRKLKNM